MDAEAEIRRELTSSESFIWAGRPRQGVVFHVYDFFAIPFSIGWLSFIAFSQATVLFAGAAETDGIAGKVLVSLFLVPFWLVGLYMSIGRFVFERWIRSRTVYGVTSERVLIASEYFGRRVKSLCLDTLTDITLTERTNGSGVLTFGPIPPLYGWYLQSGWAGFGWQSVPMFDLAEGARRVYETVRDARRAALKRSN